MDALFNAAAPIALIALMLLALVLLAKTWPRSSHAGGYGATRDGAGGPSLGTGPTVREDDDAHWNWRADGEEKPGDGDNAS